MHFHMPCAQKSKAVHIPVDKAGAWLQFSTMDGHVLTLDSLPWSCLVYCVGLGWEPALRLYWPCVCKLYFGPMSVNYSVHKKHLHLLYLPLLLFIPFDVIVITVS